MVTGGYSGLQVTGMTEWGQKSTSPKNNLFIEKQKTSLDQKLAPPPPKKSYADFPSLKSFQKTKHCTLVA